MKRLPKNVAQLFDIKLEIENRPQIWPQTQDAAFDRGLITFDENFRLVIGPRLKEFLPDEALGRNFLAYVGQPMQMPDKFLPEAEFMRKHREEVFGLWHT